MLGLMAMSEEAEVIQDASFGQFCQAIGLSWM